MRKSFMMSLLLVLVLTACQGRASETEPATLNELATSTEQPVATEQAGIYPTPEPSVVIEQVGSYPTPEPFPFPTSERGFITIHGTLLAINPFAITPIRKILCSWYHCLEIVKAFLLFHFLRSVKYLGRLWTSETANLFLLTLNRDNMRLWCCSPQVPRCPPNLLMEGTWRS